MSNEDLPTQVQVLARDEQRTSRPTTPPSSYSFEVPASPSIIQQIIELTEEGNLPDSHIATIAQQAEQIGHIPVPIPPPRDATPGGEEDGEAAGELQLPRSLSYHPRSLSPEIPDPRYYGSYLEHGPRPINEDDHPDWPWKHHQNLPFDASVPVKTQPEDIVGTHLKYTYLSIKDSIPTSISTEGRGQPMYAGQLKAKFNNLRDYDESIDMVLRECPFGITSAMDPVINRALWSIPEAGIWADVHVLRAEDVRQRELREAEARVERLEAFARQERGFIYEARNQSRRRRAEASQRLLDARATAKVLSFAEQLENEDDCEHRMAYTREERGIPPRLQAGQGPSNDTPVRRNGRCRIFCHFCGGPGHKSPQCDTPHYKCTTARKGKCLISKKHPGYWSEHHIREDCPYGGRDREQLPAWKRLFPPHNDVAEAIDQGDSLYDPEIDQVNITS